MLPVPLHRLGQQGHLLGDGLILHRHAVALQKLNGVLSGLLPGILDLQFPLNEESQQAHVGD